MKSIVTLFALSTVLASASAFAQVGDTFRCVHVGTGQADDVTLRIVSHDEVEVDASSAKIDENYDPRLNDGYLRFEYVQSDEGTSEVLVQRGLLYAARQGFIKIQWRGEGFSTDKYACKLQ